MIGSVRENLAVVGLLDDADVFAARQVGRAVAATVGLDRLDTTRMATAISEVARVVMGAQHGRVAISIRDGRELVAAITGECLAPDDLSIRSAERLVDSVVHSVVDGQPQVELIMRLAAVLTGTDHERVIRAVEAYAPNSPLDELRQQNTELLAALETVQGKNAELETLNVELGETNRGVVALYTELSDELERTNQGVVALYAEIDHKNERLTAASDAKSRFLRSISHELRTPVNSVLGLTGLLTDPGADPLTPEQHAQVEFIRTSAADLGSLVNELLDLAKAESGRLDPVHREVSVAELCDGIRGLTAPLLRPGVRLVVDPSPDELVVRTDPDLVRHVLRNLLSNAAKFTVAGTVRLTATSHEGAAAISVADTGVGMTEEECARAFEEFFQAKTPLHATTKGSGLGLPFAASVAQALGGRIEVESTLGVGSCFTLRLPLGPPESAT